MTPSNQFNNAANPPRIDPHQRQRLFVAAKQGDRETLESILAERPDAANWRQGGKSVLQAAVEKRQSLSVTILLAAKADANAMSDDKLSSPMIVAARHDDTHNMVLLIHGGAKAASGSGDTTPLMNAVRHNAFRAASVLLVHGASPSLLDDEGNAALHVSTSAHNFDTARVLLDKKADINQRNLESLTPLMLAAKEKNIFAAKFLLENGADFSLRSDLHETALDMARSFGAGDKKFLDAYEGLMAARLRERTNGFLKEMRKGVGRDVVAPHKAAFKKNKPR